MKLKTDEVDTSIQALNNPDKDIFNRKEEIENLSRIIEKINEPLVLSIDSSWGTGKTTFIKFWKSYLDNADNNIDSIHFNAWESDYTDDPLIALVSAIEKWVKDNDTHTNEKWEKAKTLLPAIAKTSAIISAKAITFGALELDKEYEKLASELSGETTSHLISNFNTKAKATDTFKKLMYEMTSDNKKLVLFIDELDRCRPTYAIETLERIKHLFNINNITFIISTDIEQLSHSICAVYGNNFNGRDYLNRFIDVQYSIKEPNKGIYINHFFNTTIIDSLFENRGNNSQNERNQLLHCIRILSNRFNLSLREIGNTCTKLCLILKTIPESNHLDIPLLTALLFLKSKNIKLYHQFIVNSEEAKRVIDFLSLGLNQEDLYGKYFSSIKGYLLNQYICKNNEVNSEDYIRGYEEIIKNHDIDRNVRAAARTTLSYANNPRDDYNSLVDINDIISLVGLYEQVQI